MASWRRSPAGLVIAAGLSVTIAGQTAVPLVRVNQAGYLPGAPKIAVLVGEAPATAAVVRDASSRREALRVAVGAAVRDAHSGDTLRPLDISALRAAGTYVIEVEGAGASDPFPVGDSVYRRPLYLALRAFYGQRCGTDVDLGPAYPHRHDACHLDDARAHPSTGRDGALRAAGGWHDAGDYGKYIVNSGITTGQLLWAWEWYPETFASLVLDIPESDNAMPDLLDELRWNLDWMRTMQDADGGVWHKLTSERFGSFTMPEKDDGGTRLVIGTGRPPFKGSCATADFAAVMAVAGRVFRTHDAPYAASALEAARRAWRWVAAHPDVTFRNPPGVSTGEYGDSDCADERLWAAAELFRTTGDAAYDTAARSLAKSRRVTATAPSWSSVGALGLWSYAQAAQASADRALQARIRQETIDAARAVAARTDAEGWRHSLRPDDVVWGSNGVAANYGVLLLMAHRFERQPAFVRAAGDNLHYLLGRNTFGVSWLTGVGVRPYRHPHHRPSGGDAIDAPWPGLLSGGPTRHSADPVLKKMPAAPPLRRWVDDEGSYASNEIAINWNAPLVLLLAGVQAER